MEYFFSGRQRVICKFQGRGTRISDLSLLHSHGQTNKREEIKAGCKSAFPGFLITVNKIERCFFHFFLFKL